MSLGDLKRFSDPNWISNNKFEALADISWLLSEEEDTGREALIRILEHAHLLENYQTVVEALIQRAGLYPYQSNREILSKREMLSTSGLLNMEFHAVDGLDDIVLHSIQGEVYRALIDGANIILSAPTSFGKSLLIDAIIASRKFKSIVVIVPTIALIDETRRRLAKRFSNEYKIITHVSQTPLEKNIYVLTQERFVQFNEILAPDFFVLDEFYKLNPAGIDERAFTLNEAFYKLLKSGAQFFLIGPNVKDISIGENNYDCRLFSTNFSTVATDVNLITAGDVTDNAIRICKEVTDPTLIFCKSPKSAYDLANKLLDAGVVAPSAVATELATWLRANYHPKWILADLLDAGIAVHHGALPRSIAYHLLQKFNDDKIKFLLCTSTIIEGVNTSAKNIIIYDKRIANQKPFDIFTFNNIKGRAGRMLRHFVGHVYVLNYDPQTELPLIDIPSLTQSENAPDSLLIQFDKKDLHERSLEKIRYVYSQDILPVEIMRSNSGMSPESQLKLASVLSENIDMYHKQLSWTGLPNFGNLYAVCELIFIFLMDGKYKDGIGSTNQLYAKIRILFQEQTISKLIVAELDYNDNITASEALEIVLRFMRQWGEFLFPRYLLAVDRIQRSVFERAERSPGNYSTFISLIKRLFMPLSATLLEEYGLPFQVTLKIERQNPLGDDVDRILTNLKNTNVPALELEKIELEMIRDTIQNL